MHVCVCIHIYMYTYMYMNMYMRVCMCACVYTRAFIYTHTCVYISLQMSVRTHVYIYIYICVCAHVHAHKYIHIYIYACIVRKLLTDITMKGITATLCIVVYLCIVLCPYHPHMPIPQHRNHECVRVCARRHTDMHPHIYAGLYSCSLLICLYSYVRTCMHTCRHTHVDEENAALVLLDLSEDLLNIHACMCARGMAWHGVACRDMAVVASHSTDLDA